MSRKKKQKGPGKMRASMTHIIRKVFQNNPESVLTHKQVCTLIDLRENALRKLAFDVLQELSENGELTRNSHDVFSLNTSSEGVTGILELTARGAGFVIPDDGSEDIFIAPHHTGQSLNGDKVKIRIIKKGKGRREGEILDVLEREKTQFVGTIEMHEKFAFLIPDNLKAGTDIYISKEKLNGALHGDKALVKITVWPKSSSNPYGEVVEVLGKPGSNDTEMISILCNHGIDFKFPQEVLEEAEHIGMSLDDTEIAKRRDFRSVLTFTIDPADAKDFDDALSFKRLENGNIEVGVHIADVSHYVQPGTALDIEALKRSNSVYLVDRVIPMLPEQLSNMACSLRPNEDKYSFSAVFELDEKGKVIKEWFGRAVIHSNRRFSYEEAQEIIEGGEGDFKEELLTLNKIAKSISQKRLKEGALSIESEEIRFKLNERGHPIDILVKTSKDAHKLIEEFMLLANRRIALFVGKQEKGKDNVPFIYRVHDKPDLAKIALFNVFIGKFGYELEFSHPDQIAKSINTLLEDIRLKNEYSLIQTMAIRSMAKASYDTTNIGHYGLAFDFYTHFTSPIRRYADLVVHRILQEKLEQAKHRYGKELDDICKRISRMERKATEAERESTRFFQTLFVQEYIGEEFTGTVSGLAEFGLFVRMDENYCEGMVPMNDIPGDRFYFDAEKFRIIGSKTKREYNFGDKVRVRIYEVHPRKRQIDLELLMD
ncbi:MAG: ribonuclease [Bacteroidota bacterium]|jgi:ribonuclease R